MDEHRNLWSPPVSGPSATAPNPPAAAPVAPPPDPPSLAPPQPTAPPTDWPAVSSSTTITNPQTLSELPFASSSYTPPPLLTGQQPLSSAALEVDQLIAANQPKVSVSDHSGEKIPLPKLPKTHRRRAFTEKHRESLIVASVSLLLLISGVTFVMAKFSPPDKQTIVSKTQESGNSADSVDTASDVAGENNDFAEDIGDGGEDVTDDEDTTAINEDDDSFTDTEEYDDYSDEEVYEESGDEEGGDEEVDNSSKVVPTPPATTVPATPVPAMTHKFTVASWNVSSTNKTNVGDQVASLMKSTQVIGLQENHDKTQRDRVKSKVLCSSCAYKGYQPSYTTSGASTASYPIIWNKSAFTQVGSGASRKMCDPAKTSSYSYAARYATWVRLKSNVNGKNFYVINTHFMDGEGDRGKPTSDSLLTTRYKTHMANLLKLIKELQPANIPVYVAGTFNVDYRYDRTIKTSYFPYQSLRGVNVFSNWELLNLSGISSSASTTGSSGKIAHYVFTWKRSDVTPNSIAISGSRFGSNSSPVYFTSTIK